MVIHLAAFRWRQVPRSISQAVPAVLASIGTLLWLAWCMMQCNGMAITAGWLFGAAVLLGLERIGRRMLYFELGLLMLVLTAGRWLALDAIATRTSRSWRAADALPLLNWQMGLAVAIAATGWWAYRILLRRQAEHSADHATKPFEVGVMNQIVLLVGFLLALIALSFEADRTIERLAAATSNLWWSVAHVRQVVLTMLWTLGGSGLGLLALTMRLRANGDQRLTRRPGLLGGVAWSIVILCAAKWLIGDTLLWTMAGRRAPILASTPLANLQMVAGILLAAAAILMVALRSADSTNDQPESDDALYHGRQRPARPTWIDWVPVAAGVIVLWGLTFEVDRLLGRIDSPPAWIAIWPASQTRQLFWSMLWSTGGLAMIAIGQWRRLATLMFGGWIVIAGAAVAWLTCGTLLWRVNDGINPATVVFNLQFVAGACVAILLAIATAWNLVTQTERDANERPTHDARVSMGLIAAIGLWLGTLEIDRFFIDDYMARQTGYSVYWGIYAVMLVLIGFKKRSAAARYVGLGLLGVTLVKAFIIDMAEVDLLWKTVIFFVVGMLLIGTSILYIRLAPKLARLDGDDAE